MTEQGKAGMCPQVLKSFILENHESRFTGIFESLALFIC